MSEFSFEDIERWITLAYDKNAPIQRAIYYDLFFQCQIDDQKFTRAERYFRDWLIDKMGYVVNVGGEA